ncbi:MAG: cryptochrome/photolyase family protein [Alcanivoracaceae bacterium]|nr:cryptochrome/photolyase family protein [Alcanivoracaceae bacterium]
MSRLILVLGDQLSAGLSSLATADRLRDTVVMAEVREEASYVPHHPKKIIFLFSAMRHFAAQLRQQGWQVDYYPYQMGLASLCDALQQSAAKYQAEEVVITRCGEWRLDQQMHQQWPAKLGIPITLLEDHRFLCSHADFQHWAAGRKQLRMEYFYREMRQRSGLLMTATGDPEGGRWNFDSENRSRYDGTPACPAPLHFSPDPITTEVTELVKHEFSHHFGDAEPFVFAVTREQALIALHYFIDNALPWFGDYQDAMSLHHDHLFHSLLSVYLNAGLLLPLETCQAVEQAWRDGKAPLNAVEGFIRQILGWREYVRGIYWLKMPDYSKQNALASQQPLPALYWGAPTKMRCIGEAVRATREHAHAHHIQRLMVTGNLALLLGVDVEEIHSWYLAVYADAYEWVELPNTLGMVMHADGGMLGSKPYAASGKYIQRMSDYCGQCHYNVATSENSDSCPLNALYWHFISRHQERFSGHPRMAMIYRNWQRMDEDKRRRIFARGQWLVEHPETL